MHPDTPMGVASCDKPWEEAAIHQLALHGRIDLNASVFRVLKIKPAGPVVDNRMYDITFNHLLEHKAGWQGEPLNRANQAYEAAPTGHAGSAMVRGPSCLASAHHGATARLDPRREVGIRQHGLSRAEAHDHGVSSAGACPSITGASSATRSA